MTTHATTATITGSQRGLLLLALMVAMVGLPMLVHLLPYGGAVPLGAKLLPLFYAPLIALLWGRWQEALVAGLLVPGLNYLLTGLPAPAMVAVLTVDLMLFVLVARVLLARKPFHWLAAPIAYVVAKLFSSCLVLLLPFDTTYLDFLWRSLAVAIPGLLILWAIQLLLQRIWQSKT